MVVFKTFVKVFKIGLETITVHHHDLFKTFVKLFKIGLVKIGLVKIGLVKVGLVKTLVKEKV